MSKGWGGRNGRKEPRITDTRQWGHQSFLKIILSADKIVTDIRQSLYGTFLLRVEQSRLGFSSPQISNTKDDQLIQLCTGGGDLTDAYANNKEL